MTYPTEERFISDRPNSSDMGVDDQSIIGALWETVQAEPDRLAASASDVSERLPIKKQATRGRLDKLATSDSPVRRWQSGQAWAYYVDTDADLEYLGDNTVTLEGKPGSEVSALVARDEYASVTEFVRDAIRRRLEDLRPIKTNDEREGERVTVEMGDE